jgi:hypothetical protein
MPHWSARPGFEIEDAVTARRRFGPSDLTRLHRKVMTPHEAAGSARQLMTFPGMSGQARLEPGKGPRETVGDLGVPDRPRRPGQAAKAQPHRPLPLLWVTSSTSSPQRNRVMHALIMPAVVVSCAAPVRTSLPAVLRRSSPSVALDGLDRGQPVVAQHLPPLRHLLPCRLTLIPRLDPLGAPRSKGLFNSRRCSFRAVAYRCAGKKKPTTALGSCTPSTLVWQASRAPSPPAAARTQSSHSFAASERTSGTRIAAQIGGYLAHIVGQCHHRR